MLGLTYRALENIFSQLGKEDNAEVNVTMLGEREEITSQSLLAYNKQWNVQYISLCKRITACNKEYTAQQQNPVALFHFLAKNPGIAGEITKLGDSIKQLNQTSSSSVRREQIDEIVHSQMEKLSHLERNFNKIAQLNTEYIRENKAIFTVFAKKDPSKWGEVIVPINQANSLQDIISFILSLCLKYFYMRSKLKSAIRHDHMVIFFSQYVLYEVIGWYNVLFFSVEVSSV